MEIRDSEATGMNLGDFLRVTDLAELTPEAIAPFATSRA